MISCDTDKIVVGKSIEASERRLALYFARIERG